MEIIQINNQNDFININDFIFQNTEFEIRMPNHMHQMYLSRDELNGIGQEMKDFITEAEEQNYEWHKWYDDRSKELIYEFNKEE